MFMGRLWHTAALAAGVAAAFITAAPARAAVPAPVNPPADISNTLSLTLRSFADPAPISAYELSATGVAGFAMPEMAGAFTTAAAAGLAARYGAAPAYSLASSSILSPVLALDSGRNLDVAARFTRYGAASAPFLSAAAAPYLGLANGGRYAGLTFVPAADLRFRLGASFNSETLDRFVPDRLTGLSAMPLGYEPSQTRALLGGISWQAGAFGIDLSGITALRSGVPLGFAGASPAAPRARTDAVGLAAHLAFGGGWVTTAAYSQGLTQLDQRGGGAEALRGHSYSLSIAKRGLFGDDTLGFSFGRPAPGTLDGLAGFSAAGDLPPMVIARSQALRAAAPETDFQLGYVTTFLDGALALQTNAAYQTNYQGRTGVNSVSLLSRAKIKF
jgi:hypothetical protein